MTGRLDLVWVVGVVGAALLSSCAAAPTEDFVTSTSALGEAQHFLVAEGVGTEAEARRYYASLGPAFVAGTYTLDRWFADNIGTRPVNQGFYRNSHELGFWREMTCTKYIGRGLGGCMVRNWNDPSDVAAGRPNQGTVTMNVSPEGFTRFFVFAPTGELSPFAVLDDEGKKFVPQVCIACHSGRYDGKSGSSSNMGAIFREFEPSLLEALPGRASASEWFGLNESIRSANTALKLEIEGGPEGVDHAKSAQNSYVRSIYASASPASSLDVRDVAHLPPSWAKFGETSTLLEAKKKLWSDVVAPYCMTCHRTNALDWADYSQFEPLGSSFDGKTLLDRYLAADGSHDEGMPFMPQAKLLFSELQHDTKVRPAIDGWVSALGGPTCAVGTPCTPSKTCFQGIIGSCSDPTKMCTATVPVPDGTPCGNQQACSQGQCVLSTATFSIPLMRAGVYVRSEHPEAPQGHVHIDVKEDDRPTAPPRLFLQVAQVSAAEPCTQSGTQVSLLCSMFTFVGSTCTDASDASGDTWKVIEGNTLQRRNRAHPELDGRYRLESPVDVPTCD